GPTRAERDGRQLTLYVEDASISSRHFELVRSGGGFSLADLGSSHGTFVDDRRTGGCELADGATILAGTTFFRFAASHADRKTLPDDLAASASAVYPGLRSVHPLLTTQLARLLTLASSTVPLWISGATG